MPIIVACPGCKMRLKAPDAAVGRAFVCPNCKANVAVAAPLPAGPQQAAAKPSPEPQRSPKIKVIEKPLLNRPAAAPTRLTVVGDAEPSALAPPAASGATPAPKKPKTDPPAPPIVEEVFTDFEVVEDHEPQRIAPDADDEPLDELEEVPEELDSLEEVEPSSPLDLSRLLAHALVRIVKKPPPGIYYKLTSAQGETLSVATAVPLPGVTVKFGITGPIRLELREGDDEVLRANIQPLRSQQGTIEVLGPGDERMAVFTFGGWAELRQRVMRIERPGGLPLQLVPQPSRRRAVLAGHDGRELGELVPGNGAWFVPGGVWEARFGPALSGRNEERLLLLCAGLGLELIERQREA